jgi:hypothetical protein
MGGRRLAFGIQTIRMSASSSWDAIQIAALVIDSILYAVNLITLGMSLRTLLLRKEKTSLRPRRDVKWKVLACNIILFLLATASLVILCVYRLDGIKPGSETSWRLDWALVGVTLLLAL